MNCEMCGKEKALKDAIVEGVMLKVCEKCSRFGKVITIERPVIKEEKKFVKKQEINEDIVEDYALKLKRAREDLNLKQEEVAKNLNEKESVIHSLEIGKLKPSLELARKLEKFFRIKLVEEKEEEKREVSIDFRDKEVTIGDLLKIKKK